MSLSLVGGATFPQIHSQEMDDLCVYVRACVCACVRECVSLCVCLSVLEEWEIMNSEGLTLIICLPQSVLEMGLEGRKMYQPTHN